MLTRKTVSLIILMLAVCCQVHGVERYNLIWESPSDDYNGSMPIGNGDLAANVWVEPNGDLIFYLSKSDAWSARHDLLKLGRFRVKLDPPLCSEGSKFRQELDLSTGTIKISSTPSTLHSPLSTFHISFWIDANNPVAHVEIDSSELCSAQVSLESWRNEGKWMTTHAERDVILPSDSKTVRWYQRNKSSIFNTDLTNQNLKHMIGRIKDPLMDLTFGGLMTGQGLVAKDDKTLVSAKPAKRFHVDINALTKQTKTAEAWVKQLEQDRDAQAALPLKETKLAHVAWWKAYWERSYIHCSGTEEADKVAQFYHLQRWVAAGAGRGGYPIKFNGSLFTVDGHPRSDKKPEGDYMGPDYRRWGGHYWFQNTRHSYWPMLLMGDYDMMQPLFNMYKDMLPLVQERVRHDFDHEGVYFPETFTIWGLNRDWDFTMGKLNPGPYANSTYIRYYWQGGLELSALMIERYRHTLDNAFVRETLLPITDSVVKFYDQHYKRGEDGKLYISPAQVLETYHEAVNPTPVIVGLQKTLTGLLELPTKLVTSEQRTRWQRLLGELPPLPMAEENGKRWLKPALSYSKRGNGENAELYGVFPYNIQGVGRPDLELLRETYRRRLFKNTGCWRYEVILAARLGFAEDAKRYLLKNALEQFSTTSAAEKKYSTPSRFPAFLHTGDWVPDQDEASIICTGLQSMLMVTGQDKGIYLLPAWPKDWTASFKLQAPYKTIVEGRVENGKLLDLKVTPKSRQKDVVLEDR